MKKSFILYNDQEKLFEQLTDAEAGILIKTVFKYLNADSNDSTVEESLNDRMLVILFNTLIQQIERDKQKYAEKCKKLRENGSKGGKARADNMKQMQANPSLNDNDNENENAIPTLKEVEDWSLSYAREHQLSQVDCMSSSQQAYEYYNSCMEDMNKRSWCDGNGKSIKNWKLKIARVWFKDMKPSYLTETSNYKVNPLNVC